MCASINDKNCNYRPCKSFITQNHLLIYGKKHGKKFVTRGKLGENTGNFISAGMWPPCHIIRLPYPHHVLSPSETYPCDFVRAFNAYFFSWVLLGIQIFLILIFHITVMIIFSEVFLVWDHR